ncbi:response regulator transcription factor [Glycomyces algeriensis]|uniref:DNA-binding response regulator n=1 Tax=Glycomyces algeriensis TaxID=256037 RepID=A0A9W6G8Y4_9ACTN|nr:response regulator transcription factor [Glycomyces algeriensis]MDA1364753.1 response regulator transcription factor [Glycomyces algeriensis]MDR7350794.1 two-component system response regulator DesR [Glycomyces algeriensis]GLI43504.1 DNA-binding response regulator [Glycomyces algeriensis]
MIRLLVADDETLVREALAVLLGLEADITVIAQADNGADAVTLAASRLPDIAVLDLEMPPQDGLWAAMRIRESNPDVKVMLVTRHARPGVLRRALAAGISGFVPKTTPAERLAQIIRDISQGRRYIDPEIAATALTEDRSPLTERELDLLRAARGGGTIEEIAAQLHLAPGTVRNYLSTAMRKLDKKTRHAAAQHAWEQGWI